MYLILWKPETRGSQRYEVPDHHHGEVYPGPYDSLVAAKQALTAYVRMEIDPNCQDDYESYFTFFELKSVG